VPAAEVPLPLTATPAAWLVVALADLDAVHQDHLHCERKAAQSALSLMRSYPERADLVLAVARLAHEETAHVVQVSQLLGKKGVDATLDHGDEYAAALRDQCRRTEPDRLLDRLLIFALIEARSAERLALLAAAIPDPAIAALYGGLATAEVRHRDTFLELAEQVAPETWRVRLGALARAEADIVARMPVRARIH